MTSAPEPRGRFVLICHEGNRLNRLGLSRWLASFTELAGIVVIREEPARLWKRIRREVRRVGALRFLDVLAFRVYGRLRLSAQEHRETKETLARLQSAYAAVPLSTKVLVTASPNNKECEEFLRELAPDVIVARCKSLLNERIFSLAAHGAFVMHPGICPEYRNAHGCFWALARRDVANVGMTLLRIDAGVDTGPVYGYYRCAFDERRESHHSIQRRVVFENLGALEEKFGEILTGVARTIETSGRGSRTWGQPWMSAYARWKWGALRDARVRATALLYHDVVADGRFEASGFQGPGPNVYKLDVSEFRRYLEAIARVCDRDAVPLLTFDDGGCGAFSPVAEMLEEFGWRGRFFITTDRIGTPGFLTESQLVALHQRGHVVGSHSCSHPARMTACSDEELDHEWRESVGVLERILNAPVTSASIPAGYYSRRVAASAARAGIRLLFTSEPVTTRRLVDGCTLAGRFSVERGVPAAWVAAVVAGRIGPRLRRYLFWNGKKLLKGVAGAAWLSLRRRILARRAPLKAQGRASTSR